MGSLILGLVAAILTLYFGVLYGDAAIIMISFSLAIFLVISYSSVVFLYFHTDVSIRIPMPIAEVNKDILAQFEIDEDSSFTAGKVKFLVVIQNNFTNKEKRIWLTNKEEYHFLSSQPGKLTLTVKKIHIYDRSGFFYISRKGKSADNVKVMPELKLIPVSISAKVRQYFGDSDTFDDFHAGSDPAEVFCVREFVDGDKLQSVHWKLSAKNNELMVKENSLPMACGVTLLFNPYEEGEKKKKSYVELLSYLASLSFSFVDLDCPHYVAWYSTAYKDVVRVRVDDEESFFVFLNHILEEGIHNQVDAKLFYEEKYRSETSVEIVEIKRVNQESWNEEVRV